MILEISRRESDMQPKILFLTSSLPSLKKKTGADIATQSFIQTLTELGCEVSVVGFLRPGETSPNLGTQVFSVGYCNVETEDAKAQSLYWLAKSFKKNLPYTTARFYSNSYINFIKDLFAKNTYDLVILDHPHHISWAVPWINQNTKVILIAHNVEQLVYQKRAIEVGNYILRWLYQREARLIRNIENDLSRTAIEIWTLTKDDASFFRTIEGSARTKVMALVPEMPSLPITVVEKSYDIALIGSWIWKPNGDGLRWFFENVYPLLPKNLSIEVAGRGADWLLQKFPNVKYRGFVSSAEEFMLKAKVIAIPSITGGGIQIKTLNSICLGLPIVATTFALRGISCLPDFVKFSDEPVEFSNLLLQSISSFEFLSSYEEGNNWALSRKARLKASLSDSFSKFEIA